MATSPFARRFPKPLFNGWDTQVYISATAFGFAGGFRGVTDDCGIPVCPARYSQPRTVTFFLTGQRIAAITERQWRLRVYYASVSASDASPQTYDLAHDQYVESSTNVPLWRAQTTQVASIFSAAGDAQVFPNVAGTTAVYALTFDASNAAHADFWAVWNAQAATGNKNRYMMFFAGIKDATDSSADINNISLFGLGCVVVQAPSPNNQTATVLCCANGGGISTALQTAYKANTAYDFLWRYDAPDWDGLQSVSALLIGRYSGGTGSVEFRLSSKLPSAATVYTSGTKGVTTGVGRGFAFRTENLLSLLVDGTTYAAEFRATGSLSAGRVLQWLEIVQSACTKTTTYHDSTAVVSFSTFASTAFTGNSYHAYFDPTWYRNMVDLLTKRQRYGTVVHRAASNDPEQVVTIDSNLTSVIDGTSGTLQLVLPTLTATPLAVLDTKPNIASLTSNDPLGLLGTYKLMWAKTASHVWNAGTGDLPGHMGLLYAYSVPNTEVPELGDLFETEPFNPEGCAATAAGLGDPGILAITNGSAPPVKFNPQAENVEDLGLPTPFEQEVPSATDAPAASSPDALGLANGTYRYRYTLRNCCTGKESDPNPSDIVVTVTAAGGGFAAQVTLSFAGVTIPGDPQVCEICVYRTVQGGVFPVMAKVGCFDPNLTSLFVDNLADEQLDFTNDGLSILNAPPPCAPVVVEFKNRLFMMGDIPDNSPAGTVSAVKGSEIITGSFDVEWTRCLEGKFIQLEGDCRPYEIQRVLPPLAGTSPPIQRLNVAGAYEGDSVTGSLYTICGHASRLWYSEPFEPECWPVVNFIDVEPGDGDRIIGGYANFDRLLVCKRRKTYVLTFSETPAEVNVPSRISSDIGCIGPRTFAQIESGTVWLSDRGLALYDGRQVIHVPESEQVNGFLVDPEDPDYVRRDALGRVIDAVGVYYSKREQYLLLLPTKRTTRGCSLMLVWDVKLRNITLLEFCQEFQSMVVAKDADGNQRVYLGDTNGFVWVYDVGHNDGVGQPGAVGTVRGSITAAAIDPDTGASYFEDSTATFIEGGLPAFAALSGLPGLSGALDGEEMGMAGACVYFRPPGGEWQSRIVYAATRTRVYVTPGFDADDVPEPGWEYMIGAIDFEAEFKPVNFGTEDQQKRNWGLVLVHEPEEFASQLRVDLLYDFSEEDEDDGAVVDAAGEAGPRTFALDYPRGRQVQPVGRRVFDHIGARLTNFAPEEPVRVIQVGLRSQVQS